MKPLLSIPGVVLLGLVLVLAPACGTDETTCNTLTCAGCCTDDGRCETGVEESVCGAGAAACVACAAPEVCSEGRCAQAPAPGPDEGGSPDGGPDGGPDAGPDDDTVVEQGRTCTATTDCLAGSEVCHPTADVCVQSCTRSADCPFSSPTCAFLSGTDTTRTCQCTTDASCNADREVSDLRCDAETAACVKRCTNEVGCSADSTCNVTTGVCEIGGVGSTCEGEGLGGCAYGNICSGSACAEPQAPTCENYTYLGASQKATLGTTGPIIFKVELVSATTDSAFCGVDASKRVRIKVSAYSGLDFPSHASALSGFYFVRANGTVYSPTISGRSDSYVRSENDRRLDAVVELCESSTTTQSKAGFYFMSGNFACFVAAY